MVTDKYEFVNVLMHNIHPLGQESPTITNTEEIYRVGFENMHNTTYSIAFSFLHIGTLSDICHTLSLVRSSRSDLSNGA